MTRALTPEQRRKRRIKRAKVLASGPCPKCGAPIYGKCVGTRNNLRYSPHRERIDAMQ